MPPKISALPLEWSDFKAAIAFAINASDSQITRGSYRFIIFAALSAYTGLPAKAIMKLTWRSIQGRTIFIEDIGNVSIAHFPIEPELQELIKSLMYLFDIPKYSDKYFAFLSESIIPNLTTPGRTEPMSMQYLNVGLKEFMRASGNTRADISTHTFRKTYARRRFEEMGQSHRALVELSKQLKHSSTSFTKNYIGV